MSILPGRALFRQLRRLRGPDKREPGPLNHVSLGSHCHMAQVLKRTGLRGWSSPFDWIFSSPGMVRDCLDDDFSDLLDRTHYESTPASLRPNPGECRCSHRLYAERHAIPFVFNHHDPATSEDDYRFLQDGVRRLRAALSRAEADNRFYLLTELPTPDETVPALARSLVAWGGSNRLAFLQVAPESASRRVETMPVENPNLTWLRLETRTRSIGLRFSDPADDAMLDELVHSLAAAP